MAKPKSALLIQVVRSTIGAYYIRTSGVFQCESSNVSYSGPYVTRIDNIDFRFFTLGLVYM